MALELLGYIANPIGSLISTIGAANANKQQAKENEKNRQWSEYMWNKANEYNTPAAQLQRWQDAGIEVNPNALLQNGGNSLASYSGNLGTDNSYENPAKGFNLGFIEAKNLKNQTELKDSTIATNESQQRLNDSNAAKADAEADVQRKTAEYKATENKYQESNIIVELAHKNLENSALQLTIDYTKDANPLQISILKEQVEKAKADKLISENTANLILEQIKTQEAETALVKEKQNTERAQQAAYSASVKASLASAAESYAMAANIGAKTVTENATRNQILAINEATLEKLHADTKLSYETAAKVLEEASKLKSDKEIQRWIATVRDRYGTNTAVIMNNHLKTIIDTVKDFNSYLKNKINKFNYPSSNSSSGTKNGYKWNSKTF